MPTLTQAQMQMYAASAGLNPPDLWAAIGMAESSGRTDVVNSIGCVGWLQINQPAHISEHPNWTVDWLKDPLHNAQAAKIVYNSQGLGAWEAYTNGAYKQYYKPNANAINVDFLGIPGVNNPLNPNDWWYALTAPLEALPGGVGGAIGGLPGVSEFTGVASGIEKGFHWISTPYNWVRIGYVILGGALLALGANLLVQSAALKFESSKLKAAIPSGSIGKANTAVKERRSAKKTSDSDKDDDE